MSDVFRIRELRMLRGMTQTQLAKAMDMKSASAVTMWESGDRNPSSDVLPHLAEVIGCTVNELYIGNPLEQQNQQESA